MKFTCEYCGNYLSDTDENCPTCGAPNSHLVRAASGVPRTIGELKAFAAKHNLPLDKMRFFLGEDCREARAFGIYQEPDGDFVVYKNKSDGSRAVRYQGKDEAYAVNELYQKMKAEIINQKQHQAAKQTQRSAPNQRYTQPESHYRYQKKKPKKPGTPFWIALVIIVLFASCCVWVSELPDKGYYTYNGGYYYSDVDHWYSYDEADDTWYITDVDDELENHYKDYYDGEDYSDYYGYSDFADSEYYHSSSSYSSGSGYSSGSSWDDDDDWDDDDWDDDDWDWDSGSDWDSGYSDWDSDW